jgi:hypothetical protein
MMQNSSGRARQRPTARRTRLEVLVDHASNAADAVDAIARLRSGKNGTAITQLITVMERELRDAVALVSKRRRR